jgi:rod shape-determining protein MreD
MRNSSLKNVYLSVLLAFMALLLPWSAKMMQIRPDFVLLVIIYWLIRAPNLCNVGTAWFVGIFVDLATGGTFGQYALAYTVTAYFAVSYQRRLVLFNSLQQAFYVFLLLIISQLTLLLLKIFSGAEIFGWQYFLPSMTGILIWQIAVLFGLKTGGRSRGV